MTFSKLSILSLPAVLFIGCSSPKSAVDNMYDALQSGNVVKLANNAEEAMSISLMSESMKECSLDKKKYTDQQIKFTNFCLQEKYSAIRYKDIKTTDIDEDKAYVEVTVVKDNNESIITFAVQKIDGRWMVKGRKKQ